MGLGKNILASEKVMDKLGEIYAECSMSRMSEMEILKEMVYFLKQKCSVDSRPSAIVKELRGILDQIQMVAQEKFGYSGPITQVSRGPVELPEELEEIKEYVLGDEETMKHLGGMCYLFGKGGLKGSAAMSQKFDSSYPNIIIAACRRNNWGYVDFNEAKMIVKAIKPEIKRYAKMYEQERENSLTEAVYKQVLKRLRLL